MTMMCQVGFCHQHAEMGNSQFKVTTELILNIILVTADASTASQYVQRIINLLQQILLRSFTLASPKTIYVSEAGLLYTSGRLMTKSIFFDLRTVTRDTPGICFKPVSIRKHMDFSLIF
jgi:hypothetical protein